jgi:DNA segregation ATPase FtsK/SpoIIIE, S-DNA-T family
VPSNLKAPARKPAKVTSNKNTSAIIPPTVEAQPRPWMESFRRWCDAAIRLLARFSRYGWDLLGIGLVAIALMGLFALFGFTSGALISPLARGLKQILGWGSIFLIIGIAFVGLLALRYRLPGRPAIKISQVLAFEGAAFCVLILLSIASGGDVAKAQAGMDNGGLIGWGLSELLFVLVGSSLRTVIVVFALIVFLIVGTGIPRRVVSWIDRKIEEDAADAVEKSPDAFAIQDKQGSPDSSHKDIPLEKKKPQPAKVRDEKLPPLNLLTGEQIVPPDEQKIMDTGTLLEKSLAEFGIPAHVAGYRIGPTVTQFAVEPGFVEKAAPDGSIQKQKVRVSQISALARDLALALSAERLRIEAPVPGRSYVGIEVPNSHSTIVRLRSILESDVFTKVNSPLAVALGRDVSGQAVVADLARMPHLLIAGTTGSGKSVCIAALTTCLVMNNLPADLRVIMVDPKMVELVRFNGVPHLLGKVETDLERILSVLQWTLGEMDHRYRLLEEAKVRDLDGYNRKMEHRKLPTLPRIVLIIDELADLMMSAPDQTERSIVRLAQMARAIGIHLVVATQRPSVDVVTGLIKANFPARISFTVASAVDSRVILDTNGAETLLGRGDMLFLNPESGTPLRSQGVMITDQELDRIVNFWQKSMPLEKNEPAPWEQLVASGAENEGSDSLIERAIAVVKGEHRASASLLQRRLKIGYPHAAHLIDELEELGIVGPSLGGGREREVLTGPDEGDESSTDDGETNSA